VKVLCISNRLPNADPAKLAALQDEEAARVRELYREGVVREVYFDKDRKPAPKGILVLECPSREAAQAILATLPMVAQGQIDFDLYVLGPYAPAGPAAHGGPASPP
jgi:muconolactone delta-isomerase